MALRGFDQDYYLDELLDYLIDNYGSWTEEKTVTDLENLLQEQGTTAEEHYTNKGWELGLSPNEYFNEEQYQAAYEKAAGDDASPITGNPYEHYLENSMKMDIDPSNSFDESQFMQDYLNWEADTNGLEMTVDELRAALIDVGDPASENYEEAFFGLTALTAYYINPDAFDAMGVGPTPISTAFSLNEYYGDLDDDGSGLEISILAPDGITMDNDRIETDTEYNLIGSDQINGGQGDDLINSYFGNDRINGAAGDDILEGGYGDDQLVGADGQDTFVYTFDSTGDTLKGTHGSDIFFFEAGDIIQFNDAAGEIDTMAELEAAETSGELSVTNAGGNIFINFADSGYTDQGATGQGQILIVGAPDASSVNSLADLATAIGENSIIFV